MKSGVSYLTLGIGLLTGPLFAYGQTPGPTLVAQAPVTVPPIRCSGNAATSPRPRAAIGRSGDPADSRAPCLHHRAGQDGPNGANC